MNINTLKVKRFCTKNKVPYRSIIIKVLEGRSCEEALNEYLANKEKYKKKFFYRGETLYAVCKKYNLNMSHLLELFQRQDKYNLEEFVDRVIELGTYKIEGFKYMYKGQSLSKYCKEHKLDYNKIKERYKYRVDHGFRTTLEYEVELEERNRNDR